MFSEHIDTCTQSEKEGVYERNAVYCSSNTTETNPYVLPFVSSSSSMYYFVLPYVCICCCWVNAHESRRRCLSANLLSLCCELWEYGTQCTM